MFSKMALRVIRLVRGDRFHDQPVMAHDILRLAGRGQMQPAQPVDMTAAAAHQIPEFLVAGRDIKLSMELVVGAHELLEIPRLGEFLLPRDGGVQLVHQPLGMFERQALDDFQFQRLTQKMRLLRQADSASEVISLRSRSNTCGAACLSRSRRPADRLGGRRKMAGEEFIWMASLDGRSNSRGPS